MTDDRAGILSGIERAVRTGRIPGGDHDDDRPAEHRPAAAGSLSTADRFILEARALGVEVFVEWSADAVRDRLGKLTAGKRVLAWNADRLPFKAGAILPGAVLGAAPKAAQALADIGVTGCHGAIAETGSLALISGPGCSRTVSLLPPVHVALVRRPDLFATMSEFFAARADAMAQAANTTFVTGPSRTADIELSLTIGVHGPGRVVVILGP
ncbi:MAG TPA: lactate utilization protein [Vicinamibacterales bacterium]|nr:lactate utilization protein [Vicinamibacterales bacterium]